MVTKVSSSTPRALGNTLGFSSKVAKVALAALGFFVAALAAVVVAKVFKGWIQPPASSERRLAQAENGVLLLENALLPLSVNHLKEKLLQSATTHAGHQDDYSIILSAIIEILEKENGIVGVNQETGQFIYQTYQAYPYALVALLGGKEAFDAIPTIELGKDNLYQIQEGLKPYLKVSPEQMSHSIMKGHDTLKRRALLIRSYNEQTKKTSVDIFLCRDLEASRWHYNDERSSENFSLSRGQNMHFIGRLRNGSHPAWKLV
jgi:hypothetical protein